MTSAGILPYRRSLSLSTFTEEWVSVFPDGEGHIQKKNKQKGFPI